MDEEEEQIAATAAAIQWRLQCSHHHIQLRSQASVFESHDAVFVTHHPMLRRESDVFRGQDVLFDPFSLEQCLEYLDTTVVGCMCVGCRV